MRPRPWNFLVLLRGFWTARGPFLLHEKQWSAGLAGAHTFATPVAAVSGETVTRDCLLSLIESQGPWLASNCMAKGGLEPGTHLPCKAFFKWPKPEDLKQASHGLPPWRCAVKGETWSPQLLPWGAGFQTKMMEGKTAFLRDGVLHQKKSAPTKCPKGEASGESCRNLHRPGKGLGERGPTAPPGGVPVQRSGGTSGRQEGRATKQVRQKHGG